MLTILIIILLAVAGFAVFIAMQPAEFKISRSTTMAASAVAVFDQVNNLRKWHEWSPWAKMDPAAKNSYEGPEAGIGAIMRWDGNSKVGAGSMTIIESRPNDVVRLSLAFLRPFKATNIAEFTFKSDNGNTQVVWTMTGKSKFIGKAMGLIFNCEKMVGGQFEKGLASIKTIVEAK